MFFRMSSLCLCISETFPTKKTKSQQTEKDGFCSIHIFAIFFQKKIVQSSGGIWIIFPAVKFQLAFLTFLFSILNFILSVLNFLILSVNSKAGPAVWCCSRKNSTDLLSLPKFWDQEMELLQWDAPNTKQKTQALSKKKRGACCF